MKQHSGRRGIVASVGAFVVAAALAFSGAAAAQAAPVTQATGSLTVHKLSDPGGTLGNPTGQSTDNPPAGAAGIPGVTYRITKLAPDLSTNQGWIAAGEMTVSTAQTWVAANPSATSFTETTAGSDGTAVFNGDANAGLPIGQYYVEETDVPDGVTAAGPFLVTVPVTNPTGNGWIYDVHVYPKNSQVDISKTVTDGSNYVVGGNVTWTIGTAVPVNRDTDVESSTFGEIVAPAGFAIYDTLTNNELTYVSSTLNIQSSATPAVITPLTAGTHYNFSQDTSVSGETTLKFTFESAGRNALKTAATNDPNSRVFADIVTTVKKSGVIDNDATVYPDSTGANSSDQGLTTTKPATIKYGKYSFKKVSNKETTPGTKDALAGAKFRVYATEADAIAGNSNYLTINSVNEWTSAANTGLVEIDGLRFSNWFDNADRSATPHSYWLVETQAPANHQLIMGPIEITVDDVETDGFDIENISTEGQPGFALPLTGGMGTAFLTIGGIAILAIVLVVARRRRSEEAAQ